MTCSECPRPITGTRRVTCSPPCRMRRHRRLTTEADARFRASAEALLLAQTEAIIAGDLDALRDIQRRAAALFAA